MEARKFSRWKAVACAPPSQNQAIKRDAIYWEHEGNAAVRIGDWKLVRKGGNGDWELYNLKADRTEMHDLANAQPERVQQMTAQWNARAKCADVLPAPTSKKKAKKKASKWKQYISSVCPLILFPHLRFQLTRKRRRSLPPIESTGGVRSFLGDCRRTNQDLVGPGFLNSQNSGLISQNSKMRLLCYMSDIGKRMARSESGRIVIEVDPLTKKKLYSNLALSGSTLKDWFSTVAEEYCASDSSKGLFKKEELISPPTLAVKANYRERTKYSVVSMFSGCGGMDLGFQGGFKIFGKFYPKLPFEIIWANDLNEAACRTYKKNLGDHIHCGDVWSHVANLPKKTDILIGGFPCQDISINGKGVGVSGARSGLYRAMVAAVGKLKPKVFVAENVRALLMKSRRDSLEQVVRDFSDLGYTLSVQLYKAVDYGVPQIRERVFIVGVPNGRPQFIPPTPERGRDDWMTSEEAIGDLIDLAEDPSINHVWSRANVSPEQGNRRISGHKPAHTIRAECHGNIQFHYKLPRRLSMREAARIQTFPDNFIFDSKLRETERQVGNAVPPVLAWHIANAVHRNLDIDDSGSVASASGKEKHL